MCLGSHISGQLHSVSPAKSATDNLILFKGSRPSCASWSVICWNLRAEAGFRYIQVPDFKHLQATTGDTVDDVDGWSWMMGCPKHWKNWKGQHLTVCTLKVSQVSQVLPWFFLVSLCLWFRRWRQVCRLRGAQSQSKQRLGVWIIENLMRVAVDFWWVEFPKLAMTLVGLAGAEDWRCTHWTCWLSFSREVFLAHSSHRRTVWHWEKSHDLSEKIVLSQWLIIIFPIKPPDLGWTPYLDKPIFILPQHSCLLWLIWTLIACHCTPCTPCMQLSQLFPWPTLAWGRRLLHTSCGLGRQMQPVPAIGWSPTIKMFADSKTICPDWCPTWSFLTWYHLILGYPIGIPLGTS